MLKDENIDKLKSVNYELKEIINNSWDGIGIIDINTKFIYFNNAFLPLFNYEKEELLNKDFLSLIFQEYKKPFLELLKANLKDKYESDINIICKRKDNQKIYVKVTVSTFENKKLFVINLKDITKEISNDEILDNYVLSMQVDKEGKIINVSNAFCTLFAYKKNHIIGLNHTSISTNESKDELNEILEDIYKKYEIKKILKLQNSHNQTISLDVKIKPTYNKYGDTTGYTALMFDISKELELNEQINQKDNILIQQSKLAIMSETLQMLSHQWRQPLNIISIKAQKLELELSFEENLEKEKIITTLNEIKKDSEQLSNTIESFNDLVDIKSNKEKVTAQKIIKDAIEVFKKDKESKNINFIYDFLDIEFLTYKNELTNVIINILVNAKEAIIKNKIKNGVIQIKQYHDEKKIFFEISDNAKGIDEEIINKIFEPYFSTKEKKHGVGLGLYTCKLIIQMHLKGELIAQNHNNGARFIISLVK